jgi:hypothetical protein
MGVMMMLIYSLRNEHHFWIAVSQHIEMLSKNVCCLAESINWGENGYLSSFYSQDQISQASIYYFHIVYYKKNRNKFHKTLC